MQSIDTVHIMLKNTTGKPKAILQEYSDNCCDDPESTLDEVWRELEKRFGSNLLVSRSLLDKLHSFSGVDDPQDIDRMEKLLAICRSARSRMGTCKELRVLNYQSELRQIWEKMPAQFQQKWQTKYMRIERETGQSPNLDHLFGAMSEYIDANSHPDFLKKTTKPRSVKVLRTGASPHGPPETGLTDVSRPTDPGKYCIFHNVSGHGIGECLHFSKLKWQDKKGFAADKKLCYNCLDPHFASNCPNNKTCTICGGPHMCYMHRDSPSNNVTHHTQNQTVASTMNYQA